MSTVRYDLRADWVRVIQRKAAEFNTRAAEFVQDTERCRFYIEPNGLGICIGVESRRARRIFDSIGRDIFPSFAPDITTDEKGVTWARFYYSEPWAVSHLYVAQNWVQLSYENTSR
jgi:hypothetical protein